MFIKYPKTWHLPWSRSITDHDRVMEDDSSFWGKYVIVTEKMDGECTTMYTHRIHARSVDSANHWTRDWVKGFWSSIRRDIPDGWRICGENVFAAHSIKYDNLPSYFLGFSIWDENNVCLPWKNTLEWFELLGITPVPVLFEGVYDTGTVRRLRSTMDFEHQEGYVVRWADAFLFEEFTRAIAKFVRKGHVQTNEHWMHGAIVQNGLKNNAM